MTIDRVVLKKFDSDKYIVIEGNRRVAALKTLIYDHTGGQLTLHESIIRGIRAFDALVYEGNRKDIAWIVQGFRHSPDAIKKWEEFSNAKFFADMESRGKDVLTIARTFGIQRKKVIQLIRSYYGFQQAREDEDYGEQLDPSKHFGFFSNIIFDKKGLWDEWLNYSDDKKIFENTENLNDLLSWILDKNRKLTISPHTRDTLVILTTKPEYADLLESFKETKLMTIDDVSHSIISREPSKPTPLDIPGIFDKLNRIKNEIEALPLLPIKRLGKTAKEKQQREKIINLLNEMVVALKDEIDMLSSE